MFQSIFIPFISIALAEFLDKSQVAIFLLSTKTKKHAQLFLGAIVAMAIVDGSAIFAGAWLTHLIPLFYLKLTTGIIFILFGLLSFRGGKENVDNKKITIKNPLLTAFTLVFLSEWGDKTQVASALFAVKYQPLLVFIGVILALSLLTLLAIYSGKILEKKINKSLINKISGIVMIVIGLLFIFG